MDSDLTAVGDSGGGRHGGGPATGILHRPPEKLGEVAVSGVIENLSEFEVVVTVFCSASQLAVPRSFGTPSLASSVGQRRSLLSAGRAEPSHETNIPRSCEHRLQATSPSTFQRVISSNNRKIAVHDAFECVAKCQSGLPETS